MGPRSPSSPPLAPPSFYRHSGFPDWGVGIALFRDAAQEELTLIFETAGLRTLPLGKRVLIAVPFDRVDEAVRGRLLGLAKGRRGLPLPAGAPLVRRRTREPEPPPVSPRPTEPALASVEAPVDLMDRKRRIPGSYEAGKRR